jgi:hypothetical protein
MGAQIAPVLVGCMLTFKKLIKNIQTNVCEVTTYGR